jgi:hypothetical protein
VRNYKSLINTAISLSITLNAISFYHPAQAGVPVRFMKAVGKATPTKTINKGLMNNLRHVPVHVTATRYRTVRLPSGVLVNLCHNIFSNGNRSGEWSC